MTTLRSVQNRLTSALGFDINFPVSKSYTMTEACLSRSQMNEAMQGMKAKNIQATSDDELCKAVAALVGHKRRLKEVVKEL